jgi:hypothetical protein
MWLEMLDINIPQSSLRKSNYNKGARNTQKKAIKTKNKKI